MKADVKPGNKFNEKQYRSDQIKKYQRTFKLEKNINKTQKSFIGY